MGRVSDKMLENMINICSGWESLPWSTALQELKERRETDEASSCDSIKKDKNGKCVGYQKSDTDDEPAEKCMECPKNVFYEG